MMANFAALVSPLSISGSRLTDGTPNASGTVYFFQPGGNTPVNVYADAAATTIVTQPVTLGAGGKLPTQYAAGIFTTQPVRMLIQDADGTTVTDNVFIPATAGNVGVRNDGFTDSTLDGVLTDAFTSVGGTDWKYKESGGATARTIKAKFAEIWISVKDFGAVGDGVAIDTTAIQNTINRVVALGGGVVYLPPGTYLVDQALTHSSATGVRIVGAGRATTITSSHATANLFTFTSPTNCSIESFRVLHSTATTAAIMAASGATDMSVLGIIATTNGYAYGLDFSGSSNWFVVGGQLRGTTRTLRSNSTSGRSSYVDGVIFTSGSTASIELNGSAGSIFITNNTIAGTTGILVNSAFTGSGIRVVGNWFNCTTNIDTTGLATLNGFYQDNNGLASATSSATGASQTPVLFNGNEVILTAASGGAGTVTVNAPATLPGTGTDNADMYWDFVFNNAAGGAVTWDMNAVYVGTGTGFAGTGAVPTTAAHTISIRFRWDRTTSKLRAVAAYGDTVT